MTEKFHEILRKKMDDFVHIVYRLTTAFPKEERYGATSQLRRATLSVILNYIEGFARNKRLVKINFFEISFGSLKESRYLLQFSLAEGWIDENEYMQAVALSEEIGAMLWRTMRGLDRENI